MRLRDEKPQPLNPSTSQLAAKQPFTSLLRSCTAIACLMSYSRLLIIRRDNIGDLLCTTPLIHGLRQHFPKAHITLLASSYNAPILERNPDVDEVLIFLKRHQKSHGHSFLSMLWHRWKLAQKIRRRHFDAIILANGGWRYAHRLGSKKLIGFRERHQPNHRQPDVIVPLKNNGVEDHEVVKMAALGAALGVSSCLGPTHLFPDREKVQKASKRLIAVGWLPEKKTIALHISSRQPTQRWPQELFVTLAKQLIREYSVQILLFWSPGKKDDPMHPGDDEKAAFILRALSHEPVYGCPTENLPELIATLSLANQVICSDGGAMHVAAALKKPIVCFFGQSNLAEWHPWNVPYIAIQPPSKIVADISIDEALNAFSELQKIVL